MPPAATLKRTLAAVPLRGTAVGLVIAGDYCGWRHSWARAETLGFLVTICMAAAMYFACLVGFNEPGVTIPQAGGPFAYDHHAFGPVGGAVAEIATLVEVLFALSAIRRRLAVTVAWVGGLRYPTLVRVRPAPAGLDAALEPR